MNSNTEETPIDRAYARALNFVASRHYPPLASTQVDDPFFASPLGNCCATDVLIAKVKELEETLRRFQAEN